MRMTRKLAPFFSAVTLAVLLAFPVMLIAQTAAPVVAEAPTGLADLPVVAAPAPSTASELPGPPTEIDLGDGVVVTVPPGAPWWAVLVAAIAPWLMVALPVLKKYRTIIACVLTAVLALAAAGISGNLQSIGQVVMAAFPAIATFLRLGMKNDAKEAAADTRAAVAEAGR